MGYKPRKKRGRPRQGAEPLTAAQRQARWRENHPELNRARAREGMDNLRQRQGSDFLSRLRQRNERMGGGADRNRQFNDNRPRFRSPEQEAEYDYQKLTGHRSTYKPRPKSTYEYAIEMIS
jgi:hypothetical protein